MVIVLGWLEVAPRDRAAYLDGCRGVVEAARAAPGCLEFHLSADPLLDERINVVERWATAGDVAEFRGDGPSSAQQDMVTGASVCEYEVGSWTSLT